MKNRMTTNQAIHIIMHLDQYVEHDEDFGNMIKAPLMDACVMAIKALKAQDKIVHCEHCEYGDPDDEGWYLCRHHGSDWNKGDHFCGYGERRAE